MQIGSLIMILFSGAVTLRRDKSILYNRISISILLILFIINTINSSIKTIKSGIGLYGGLFHVSSINLLFNNTIYGISCIILLITSFYSIKRPRIFKLIMNKNNVNKNKVNNEKHKRNETDVKKTIHISNDINATELLPIEQKTEISDIYSNSEKKTEKFKILEYPLVLQFVITGAIFLMASSDIVSIFLSIELQSYGLYLLAAMYRNSEFSVGAGLTYFLLGGMSSCFILLGTALLYTNSGVTSLEGFYIIKNIWDVINYDSVSIYQNSYIIYSLIIITVGFLFKVSAAPFHFWSPDVYDAIPTVVTTFVAIIAKLSILVFLLEIVHYTSNWAFTLSFDWKNILLLSSLLSMIIGSVQGLNQFRIKRLYAYSTISHLGFILLALSINTVESIQGFIFYLIQYSVSNLNAFMLLISIGYILYTYKNDKLQGELLLDKNNSPIQLINQIRGLFYINPVLALSLVITIYSFVGIPPLLGFFGKQMVLSAAMDNGLVFISLVAILTSVISAVYYLSLIKNMFFYKPDYYMSLSKIDNFTKIKTKYKRADKINNSYEYLNNLIGNKYKIELFSAFSVITSIITLLIIGFLLLQEDLLSLTNNVSIYILNI